jgi:thiamine-monophosphate kinase
VLSTDTLVEGRHFFADTPPDLLGYRALAVNLSDLAAMGATPSGFLVALVAPTPELPARPASPSEAQRVAAAMSRRIRCLFRALVFVICPRVSAD